MTILRRKNRPGGQLGKLRGWTFAKEQLAGGRGAGVLEVLGMLGVLDAGFKALKVAHGDGALEAASRILSEA